MLERVAVLPAERVPLAAAMWSVLAEPIVSAEAVPPFENSAVDGYAVRAADVAAAPLELQVIDEVAAGAASSLTVGAGQAIRIMTGAPMPAGADASVMVEDTERLGDGAAVLVK
ncbi:MAG: moeA, partial [Acidimicrobiaceae bacterium]